MIIRKNFTFWILFLFLLSLTSCQEVSKDFVQRNEKYYRVHSNDEIPDDMRDVLELDDTM